MVSRLQSLVNISNSESAFSLWLDSLHVRQFSADDISSLKQCFAFVKSGDVPLSFAPEVSSFGFALQLAELLHFLRFDPVAMVAGMMLFSVKEGQLSLEDLRSLAGDDVVSLVEGVQRMDIMRDLSNRSGSQSSDSGQADNLRKMLLSMVKDVRVVVVKLAEQLSLLRVFKSAPREDQLSLAHLVMDIYAPLANRLGMGQLKWELEDLAYRYLEPENYADIARVLDERRVDREVYVKVVIGLLEHKLSEHGIPAKVDGRVKHIYSIVNKMKRKQVSFEEIFDVRAVRVLVDSVEQCYSVLGIVHSLWRHVPSEFDDYINNPKDNGYRSIHTAVVGPESQVLEIQVRTREMHREAELGIAAHWQYKEGYDKPSADLQSKVAWLRKVLEWQEELEDSGSFLQELQTEVSGDRVYVFTPAGDIVDLVKGATPVDFAYAIHTEVGHRCSGAKVHGRIVPLSYQLVNGDRVEILTGSAPRPSRDWLYPDLGYIKTPRARAKVHSWFKLQDAEQHLDDGRKLVQRELKRLHLSAVDFVELARKLNFPAVDVLYTAVGSGSVKLSQVVSCAQRLLGVEVESVVTHFPRRSKAGDSGDLIVGGEPNLVTRLGQCCCPMPGDPVVGYVTRGQGVTVHQVSCANIVRAQVAHSERLIEVSWGGGRCAGLSC